MTIVFFSNYINHYQKAVGDELYELTGGNYYFIEMTPLDESRKKEGFSDFSHLPYVIRAWENSESYNKAVELSLNADVAIFGGPDSLHLAVQRARKTNKLSFEVSERWLKKGLWNILSPRLLKSQWYYHTLFKNKPFYKLCSSAFGANDHYFLKSYVDKCYKWGYFSKVNDKKPVKQSDNAPQKFSIMWCCRFLQWKHPEMPILLAKGLNDRGYNVIVDMYGAGELYETSVNYAKGVGLQDSVRFCGTAPNESILKEMRNHDLFVFTSDQGEGWGVVANEAMSNGAVLLASDEIGAIPYLIEDKYNGFTFKSPKKNTGFTSKGLVIDQESLKSLIEKAEYIISNRDSLAEVSQNAFKTISEEWSPNAAAKNLLCLIEDLSVGNDSSIASGPCSKAYPV